MFKPLEPPKIPEIRKNVLESSAELRAKSLPKPNFEPPANIEKLLQNWTNFEPRTPGRTLKKTKTQN